MNISGLESRTGVTKQNIRFYEKRGLLHPVRNAENNYREYTEEDVRTLQTIKVLRKLDISIEEIRKLFLEEQTLPEVMEQHLKGLKEQQKELEASICVCKSLLHTRMEELDAPDVLQKMERMEKEGGRFMSIINDYKKVSKAQSRRSFMFTPDTMVKNEREFTEALLQYAENNNLNLVITKESMYPVFEIDGVEYTAERQWRKGRPAIAYIICTMTHPEEAADDADVPEGRRKLLRYLHRHMGAIVVIIGLIILRPDMFTHWWGWAILIAFVPIVLWNLRIGE